MGKQVIRLGESCKSSINYERKNASMEVAAERELIVSYFIYVVYID